MKRRASRILPRTLVQWAMCAALSGFCHAAMAQAADDSVVDARAPEIAAAVRAGMERHDVPGASLAVIQDYRVLWAEGFGRRVAKNDQPVLPTTLFQAASVSKPITALAVMKLAEQGRLDLGEDVNRRLKSWRLPDSPLARDRPVTLRHLLSHTAGLTVHGFPGYAAGAQVPSLVQILDGVPPVNTRPIRVDVKPGYLFRYSGGGYCVTQQLLIDVTGLPFPDLMRSQVLEPLGMTHSTYEQPLPEALLERAAFGHREHAAVVPGNYHIHPEMAAAGLWTTPGDLALAVIDVARSAARGEGKLLAHSAADEMLTIQKSRCGLGFFVEGQGRKLSFSHGGANEGYRCHLICYPATGQGLVIMTNSDQGDRMFADVIKLAAKLYAWP